MQDKLPSLLSQIILILAFSHPESKIITKSSVDKIHAGMTDHVSDVVIWYTKTLISSGIQDRGSFYSGF